MSTKSSTECDSPELFSNLTSEQQKILLIWIDENLAPIQSFNDRHTSYGLKHIFGESQNGFYIYNGAFKGAMLKSGYHVQDETALNWVFNISQKSKAFQSHH